MVGNPERRLRRKTAAKSQIIKAARKILLNRTTVDSLSLRQVAQCADYAPATIYLYFKNRMALIVALFEEALELLSSYILPALKDRSGVPRLKCVGEAFIKFAHNHPQDLSLIFQSSAHVPTWDEYVVIARPFNELVRSIREDAIKGEIRLLNGLDETGTAYAFWGLIFGMADLRHAHLKNVKGDFATYQKTALKCFLKLLEPTNQ